MLSPKNALGIFLYVNIVSWLLLLVIKLITLLGFSHEHISGGNFYFKGLLLNLFLLIIFFYFSAQAEKIKEIDFVELLSNLFIVGLVANTGSLIIQLALSFLEEQPPGTFPRLNWVSVLQHINIALVMIFLTQAFFYWKKMVLYQKSERLVKTWNIFEYLLLVSLLFNFFEFDLSHLPFSLSLGILLVVGLVLSVNLKWVAYLTSKEKWQSILLLLFISIFSYYFFYTVIDNSDQKFVTTNLMHSVYVLAMFVFVIFYSIFSLLVIIFNLPTTSVFEKKSEDVLSFKKLVQSLQGKEKEDQVYEILLDTAMSSVNADAAWLEVRDEQGRLVTYVNRNIELDKIQKIKRIQKKSRLNKILDSTFSRGSDQDASYFEELPQYDFESILTAPLTVNEKSLGSLILLKKVKDGFDEDKRDLIITFARQASLSIENFRLLTKTIETERYKEELKIAQRVQQSLLPRMLDLDDSLEVHAFSESAYEVGGDYYDIYKTGNGKILVVVGDVSGKGTNAAFHMSQMKGIFQSLAQLNLNTRAFLEYANQALINCLAKSSFITITIMLIDPKRKQVEFSRAGHCPTLYYEHAQKKADYYKGQGLGLGILRNEGYSQYIDSQTVQYSADDIILLYTDGIVEAINARKEEYGYNRLARTLEQNADLRAKPLLEAIMEDVKTFCRSVSLEDDYTAVLIKFKD